MCLRFSQAPFYFRFKSFSTFLFTSNTFSSRHMNESTTTQIITLGIIYATQCQHQCCDDFTAKSFLCFSAVCEHLLLLKRWLNVVSRFLLICFSHFVSNLLTLSCIASSLLHNEQLIELMGFCEIKDVYNHIVVVDFSTVIRFVNFLLFILYINLEFRFFFVLISWLHPHTLLPSCKQSKFTFKVKINES